MNSRRSLTFFAIGFLICIFSPSHASTGNRSPLPLVVQLGKGDYGLWDKDVSASVRINVNDAVHGQLFYVTREYDILPGLVANWSWDYKANSYTLHLDKAARFHDFSPLTSKEVEFALIKPFISYLPRYERQLFIGIVGIDRLTSGMPFKSGMVPGIQIIDDHTLRVKLTHPDPVFLYSLAESLPAIAPIHQFESDLYSFGETPVGAGKFRVAKMNKERTRVTLARVDNRGSGLVDDVIFLNVSGKAFENNVDIALNAGIDNSLLQNGFKELQSVTLGISVIDFNFANPISANLVFRQVVSFAINKSEVFRRDIEDGFGKITNQFVPEDFYGRINATDKFNLTKAKELFWQLPQSIRSTTHKIYYHGFPKPSEYLVSIQKQLEAIGLKTSLHVVDGIDFENKHRDGVMYIYGKLMSFVDPLAPFSYYLPTSRNKYNSPIPDPLFRRLYEAASRSQTIEGRAAAIRELQQFMQNNFRHLPLFDNKAAFAIGPRVKSIGIEKLTTRLDLDRVVLK